MDAEYGSLKGGTNNDFIASAYFVYSVSLAIKSRKALGLDVGFYEELYDNIYKAFLKEFPVCNTHTECVLALAFGLTDDAEGVADKLVGLIMENGNKLTTGFVGTPYLLQVLSDNGYTDLAYTSKIFKGIMGESILDAIHKRRVGGSKKAFEGGTQN